MTAFLLRSFADLLDQLYSALPHQGAVGANCQQAESGLDAVDRVVDSIRGPSGDNSRRPGCLADLFHRRGQGRRRIFAEGSHRRNAHIDTQVGRSDENTRQPGRREISAACSTPLTVSIITKQLTRS